MSNLQLPPIPAHSDANGLSLCSRLELIEQLQRQRWRTGELQAHLQLAQWRLRRVSFKALRRLLQNIVLMTRSQQHMLCRQITALGGFSPLPELDACALALQCPEALSFCDCLRLISRDVEDLASAARELQALLAAAHERGERVQAALLAEVLDFNHYLVGRIRHVLVPEARLSAS
ncbi:hypothetical protein ACYU03_10315 [Pseudomonas sp. X10]